MEDVIRHLRLTPAIHAGLLRKREACDVEFLAVQLWTSCCTPYVLLAPRESGALRFCMLQILQKKLVRSLFIVVGVSQYVRYFYFVPGNTHDMLVHQWVPRLKRGYSI